ncbi:MAG TPA: P-type conjugative transfer protein TrbL [Thermoanaerobaculia bacterium]|nr:P-type conjugative transfer protein TrbL [Thermoanaerobaculia bacterium]
MDLTLLNQILDSFDQALAAWSAALHPVALSLFWGLATIEWSWTWLRLTISQRAGLEALFEVFLRKAAFLGFLLYLIQKSDILLPLILSSFQQAGGAASGIHALHPSGFLSTGVTVALHILGTLDNSGFLIDPLGVFIAVFSSFLVLLAFFAMAITVLLTLVESYVVLAAAYVLLGFGASRWTYALAESALSSVLRLGVKLLLTYLVAGVIASLTTRWANQLLAESFIGPLDLYVFLGGVACCASLLWAVPRLSAQYVPATLHLGLKPVVFDN